jgi:hypothetical protein
MLTEQLSNTQFYCLMTGIIALALAGLLIVIVWPINSELR